MRPSWGAAARALVAIGCLSSTAGCALLTKQDPLAPRYYSPEIPERAGDARQGGAAVASPGGDLALRLGRVGSAASLRERIMHRDSAHEVGFYEERRWTERPEVYLQRALARALFEERGLVRAVSGAARTLEVELTELEEVRGPRPMARLRVTYVLHDERVVGRARTVVIERPLAPGADGEGIAAGLGDALRAAVLRIGDDVVSDLRATTATPPPCSPLAVVK